MRGNGVAREGQIEFVEAMGRYFESLGIPRTGGRIIGLLLIADRPLSLDEMATALNVSRAAISTNARLGLASGMVERVTFPGDRRDYYVFSDNAWQRRLEIGIEASRTLRALIENGRTVIDPDNQAARERLSQAVDHFLFLEESLRELLVNWSERASQHRRERREAGDRHGG